MNSQESEFFDNSDRGALVTARGTSTGLVLRIDGRKDQALLEQALRDFMAVRRKFLEGQQVTLEWMSKESNPEVSAGLSSMLERDYGVIVSAVKVRQPILALKGGLHKSAEERRPALEVVSVRDPEDADQEGASSPTTAPVAKTLFDGVETVLETRYQQSLGSDYPAEKPASTEAISGDPLEGEENYFQPKPSRYGAKGAPRSSGEMWDDPDARVVYTTLRSGQRIETEHSLILFGDVNSGAEIIAGGDVIVLGTLRGVAHAGAFEEAGGGRVIFALSMEPTQLRIGTVINRGGSEQPARMMLEKLRTAKAPEIARVDGDAIVVEPYRARTVLQRFVAP